MKKDISGQRFGRLIATDEAGRTKNRKVLWQCQCDCGNEIIATSANLINRHTQSCGCLRGEIAGNNFRTHGMRQSRVYRIWSGIWSRCNNSKRSDYYGRVTVCDRWQKFENFWADMGSPPSLSHTIDRYPLRTGNYEPGNCRWATPAEQARNRKSTRFLTLTGETFCLKDWAQRKGIKRQTLEARLNAGWSVTDALTTPLRRAA